MCEKPVFVSGTWILDSNRSWDSGFLEDEEKKRRED